MSGHVDHMCVEKRYSPHFSHPNSVVEHVRACLAVHHIHFRWILEHVDRTSRDSELHFWVRGVGPCFEEVVLTGFHRFRIGRIRSDKRALVTPTHEAVTQKSRMDRRTGLYSWAWKFCQDTNFHRQPLSVMFGFGMPLSLSALITEPFFWGTRGIVVRITFVFQKLGAAL